MDRIPENTIRVDLIIRKRERERVRRPFLHSKVTEYKYFGRKHETTTGFNTVRI